ncbi:MAG TPA: type II secretion system F family protein [Steroidobacteraceae bacterium]|nr:type II secretion system F family protein [Steroidobacteraceae bacterium]
MTQGIGLFLLLVFFTVFLLLQGTVVPIVSGSRKMQKRIEGRLSQVAKASAEPELSSLLRAEYLRELSPLERSLESMPGMEGLRRLLDQAGSSMPAYRLVIVSLGAAVIGVVTAWMTTRLWYVATAGLIVGAMVPLLLVMRGRAKRFAKFEEQMPEAIDMIERALKAGHPFAQTLKLVAEDMQEPIAREFELTFADLSYGNDPRRALLGLLQRMPSVSVMALVTAVLIQRETGGNLAENLSHISRVIRGRYKFQRRVKTLSAEGRLSGWVLSLMPLTLFGILWLLYPDYTEMLTQHAKGPMLIFSAVGLGSIGAFWISRIVRIDL